jgi:hypothetical protein
MTEKLTLLRDRSHADHPATAGGDLNMRHGPEWRTAE